MEFPKWQLHRGYWKEGVRENTMEAFRQAKVNECEMIELDAQLSRDNVFHVFHDFSLKRFFHVDQKVKKTSSEDLSGLNIPTLQEVLESEDVPEYINIEIKSKSLIVQKEIKVLRELLIDHKGDKKVLLSSFNPMVVYLFNKWLPDTPRALIVGDKKVLMSRRFEYYVQWTNPDYINCHYSLIDDEEARDHLLYYEKPLMVWTVNEHEKARFYLTRGAKSIISDLPPRVV
jgi:glycerophosphoryl diester phosphodiesterase